MRTDQLRNMIREIPAHQQCLLTETDGKAALERRQCLACRRTSPHVRDGCKAGVAGREERGAQPQGQMCVCLGPLARGRWGGLPPCTGYTAKPNMSCQPAACKGTNDSCSRSVSTAMVLFQDCCAKQKKFCEEGVALATSVLLCWEKQQEQKDFVFTIQSLPAGTPTHHTYAWNMYH